MPLSEIVLIARHVQTAELHTYLRQVALDDLRDPATPAPQAVDASGRSAQRFVVEAVVKRAGKERRIVARGHDIYAFTAPLICEAAARLLTGQSRRAGAQPPGAIFAAQELLSVLTPDYLALEMTTA